MAAKFIVFIVLLGLLVGIMPVVPVVADDTVPLDYHDSGYDLAAGYRYSIGMVSHCRWIGICALAAFEAGPVKAELRGSHLKVWINNAVVFDEDVAQQVTLNIIVECDGSGTVEVGGQGTVGGFSIDHSYRIMVYTETLHVWPSDAYSSVTISRQAMNCQITNPSLTPVDENPAQQVNYNPLIASIMGALGTAGVIAFVFLLLGVVAIVIIIFVKQAKKRKWI